jgi:hypothetical protein
MLHCIAGNSMDHSENDSDEVLRSSVIHTLFDEEKVEGEIDVLAVAGQDPNPLEALCRIADSDAGMMYGLPPPLEAGLPMREWFAELATRVRRNRAEKPPRVAQINALHAKFFLCLRVGARGGRASARMMLLAGHMRTRMMLPARTHTRAPVPCTHAAKPLHVRPHARPMHARPDFTCAPRRCMSMCVLMGRPHAAQHWASTGGGVRGTPAPTARAKSARPRCVPRPGNSKEWSEDGEAEDGSGEDGSRASDGDGAAAAVAPQQLSPRVHGRRAGADGAAGGGRRGEQSHQQRQQQQQQQQRAAVPGGRQLVSRAMKDAAEGVADEEAELDADGEALEAANRWGWVISCRVTVFEALCRLGGWTSLHGCHGDP